LQENLDIAIFFLLTFQGIISKKCLRKLQFISFLVVLKL